MTGTLTDTYVAALQHDLVELPVETRQIGVVRRPSRWLHAEVDENRPVLGPPADLLETFQEREEAFALDGLCDEEAHNAAWDAVDFEERYREYLDSDEDAQAAIEDLRAALATGTDVALVCYENTDQKRCHRTTLRELIDAGR